MTSDIIQAQADMNDALRDIIQVKNLRVSAFLGVNESERMAKQRLVITLSLSTDLRSTASQDSLASTYNYSNVTKVVTAFVERSAYFTLEALTEAIARVLIMDLGVSLARVRVEKPEALGRSCHRFVCAIPAWLKLITVTLTALRSHQQRKMWTAQHVKSRERPLTSLSDRLKLQAVPNPNMMRTLRRPALQHCLLRPLRHQFP